MIWIVFFYLKEGTSIGFNKDEAPSGTSMVCWRLLARLKASTDTAPALTLKGPLGTYDEAVRLSLFEG